MSSTAKKTAPAKPAPPAAAVAQDAHWAAKRERLRARQRPTAKMTICDDHQVKDALNAVLYTQTRLRERLAADPTNKDLTEAAEHADAEAEAAQAAFDAVADVLVFQALERTEFEDLKAAHPPTETQADDGATANAETLGPVLISRSSLDGITEDDARHFLNTWSAGEAARLFQTAWDVQSEVRFDVGKG
ncbi:hypothetical protein [Streptomyces hebeiensis]